MNVKHGNVASLPPEAVANMIDWPLEDWPGNCFGISKSVENHERLMQGFEAVYGHYRGPVARTSMLAGRPIQTHGWLQSDERICDPTRWVFENEDPYIYVADRSEVDDYDVGGNRLRSELRDRLVEPDFPDDPEDVVDEFHLPPPAVELIRDLFDGNSVGKDRLRWALSQEPQFLTPYTKRIYRAAVDAGYSAFIPIDNRRAILDEE